MSERIQEDLDVLFESSRSGLQDSHHLEFQSKEKMTTKDLARIRSNLSQIQLFRKNQTNVLRIVQKYTFETSVGDTQLKTTFYKQRTPKDQKIISNYIKGLPANRKLVYQQIMECYRKREKLAIDIGANSITINFDNEKDGRMPRAMQGEVSASDDNQEKGSYFITQSVE